MTPESAVQLPVRRQRARLQELAGTAAYALSNFSGWLFPLIVSDCIASVHLSATQAGLVVAAETLAIAVSSLLLTSHSFGLRYVTMAMSGATLAIVATVASANSGTFSSLMTTRILAGLGEGGVMMAANSLAASDDDPDSSFARMNVVNILYGSAAFLLMPWIWSERGGLQIFYAVTCGMLLPLPLLFWMSRRTASDHKELLIQSGQFRPIAAWSLVTLSAAMLFIGSAAGASWTFMAEFGKQARMSDSAIDSAIGMATLSAIIGSSLASTVFRRFGRFVPLIAGIVILAAACFGLAHVATRIQFQTECIVILVMMYFLLPGMLSAGADMDRSGRSSAVVGAVFMLTLAIGPSIAGVIVDRFGMPTIGVSDLGMCAVAIVCLLLHRVSRIGHD